MIGATDAGIVDVGDLDSRAIGWLTLQGVPPSAFACQTEPRAIGAARVLHDPSSGTFAPCVLGRFAYVIPEVIDDETVDLVAWSPASAHDAAELSPRYGEASMLGEDWIGRDGLGTTGLPLPVHRDPLAWLRSGRIGVVIVGWERAAVRLSGIIIEPRDRPDCVDAFARELSRRLAVAPPVIVRRHPALLRSAA